MALKPFSSIFSVLIIAFIFFFAQSAVAQYTRKTSGRASTNMENSWEIGFSGGVSKFLTSINPNSDALYKKFNYWNADFNAAISLLVIKNISPKFNAEFLFLTTKLSGNWNENNGYPIPPYAITQGLAYPNPFKTGINQFDLLFVANLNQIVAPNRASDKWYLYIKGGGGATFLKAYSGLFPYGKTDKLKYTILYGGGLSYRFDDKIKLKLGTMWSSVETDRLDGVHTDKPNGDISTDAGYYFNVKERYIYSYIGITYGFGNTISKAESIRGNNRRSSWTKPSKRLKSANRIKRNRTNTNKKQVGMPYR